jgi:two-component system, NtrC family, response regulator
VESMLFGHEKGAFTGADRQKEGLFRHAHKGTLFLDEIGELPLSLQKVFLRVLQERRFRPIGGKKEIESDFRLLAATNQNLDKMVQDGTFRQDLLFRIQTISIQLPPLRERKDDIREIALHHFNKTCKISGEPIKGFAPDFFETLELYNWPGNVRELLNTLDKVMSDAFDEPILFPRHLPTKIRVQVARRQVKGFKKSETGKETSSKLTSMQAYLDEAKTIYLADLMAFTHGNIKTACAVSGLSRSHLYQLLKKYEISAQSD